ncbi:hypothetical protein B5X24_HaOG201660 [Helicoverpa armigera]|nr:hypothetical protein B5X24_HaOG201660 [Helicoverpa armigera]
MASSLKPYYSNYAIPYILKTQLIFHSSLKLIEKPFHSTQTTEVLSIHGRANFQYSGQVEGGEEKRGVGGGVFRNNGHGTTLRL